MRDAPDSGSHDYQVLLTVIAGISLAAAATVLPVLIAGPYWTWLYWANVLLWVAGIAATILEYLAVLHGSRYYLRRVDLAATSSLVLVFLALAGLFVVIGMGGEWLAPQWFVLFAIFGVLSALEAEHGRRVIVRHAVRLYGAKAVRAYVISLRQVALLMLAASAASLLFAVAWPDPPSLAVFVASVLVLAGVLAANVQQHRIRVVLGTR
ncbi:hypothetical protein [Jiangella alkaliphila]|uniref:Uncharacterized protein n=1 Tax=Jiangella alkaliphila TaxID=419479 RepID=A0A1H2LU16_9ACTN|nr:hypothetical protein [Jiangella alkaliphila]SDU84503.1 hypothetical protein SAMN04488563_6660 [Jiangella alkaliphila]